MFQHRIIAVAALLFVATSASASTVTVVIINESGEALALRPVSKNERNTLMHASASLPQILDARTRTSFEVAPYVTSDVNFAAVRYHSRRRSCSFLTSYVNLRTAAGGTPQWNHKAQGGANCVSRIVERNPYTHDWTVEFTIR